MPYRDAWDIKPPGIFLIYAAARALFGGAQIGIRILEVAGLALMCWGMVRLAARLWHEPRIGFVAAVLALIAHARLDFWSTAQPETFGGMLTIAGLLCAVPHGDRAASPYRLFLCGALFSAAGLLKPPLVGGAAVVALYLLNKDGSKSRESAARVTALSAGVIVPVVVCAA